MSPGGTMETVGIREMKAHLSAYLKKVRMDGASVAVTDRGKVIAVLCPPESVGMAANTYPSLAERALALGGQPATAHGGWDSFPSAPPELRELAVQAALDELRGDR